jgi:predicted dehydrogenase/acetyltransferase-like isoleucine patch superfamily enzyme
MSDATGEAHAMPRVAVIGCGHWGRNLIRNFHEQGALVAVSDADPAMASTMAERYGVPAILPDEAIAAEHIDAVVLATPAATHARLAISALGAGKHVFVEKPLALDVADGLRIAQVAQARQKVVMVGHLLQYHPAFLRLKEMVAEGCFGRLRYIYSNRLNLGRFRHEEDVLWSFAPHDISMILSFAGDRPQTVQTIAHSYLRNGIADVTTTHLRFQNGINAHVFVSWLHPSKEQKLILVGDDGMAVFDDGEAWPRKLIHYPHRIAWQNGAPLPTGAQGIPVPLEPAEPLAMECRHFLDCIREDTMPRTHTGEAIGVLRVLDAARRSMASGQPVTLTDDAPKQYFVQETACVDDGCEIGDGTKIWHFSHILRGTKIGRDCVIGQNVVIGPDVVVGNRCKIQNNVSLYKGVVLEDGVFCGPSCVFTNVMNPRADIERKDEFRPTVVGRGATIGANATIVCGHDLGAYSFIGAGAVITAEVPAHALMVGNPARRIGWMSRAGYRLGEDLVCPRTGDRHGPDGRGGLRRLEKAPFLVEVSA